MTSRTEKTRCQARKPRGFATRSASLVLLLVSLAVLVLGSPRVVSASLPKVYVFVATDEKPLQIQNTLGAALSGFEVTVFGRPRDLEQALQRSPAAAVLAPTPTLRDLGLAPTLHGVFSGSTTEPYVLVTVDRPLSPSALKDESVGMFAIMGRSGMKDFCGNLLDAEPRVVTTVTKYADLLPLLQFKAAKGVILPRRFSQTLTKRSALNLVVSELNSGSAGVLSAAVSGGSSSSSVTNALRSLNKNTLSYLGIDGWK